MHAQHPVPSRRRPPPWRLIGGLLTLLALAGPLPAAAGPPAPVAPPPGGTPLAAEFQRDVTPLLTPSATDLAAYAASLRQALASAGVQPAAPQFVLLVDRSPRVQAALLYWGAAGKGWKFVGAAPVSTGLPGRFEHFTTPLGVFAHRLENPDFRSEGTPNKLGFRGYGSKGLRIYDFGWVPAPRGWGDGAPGELRLQMHATDPQRLAPRLGSPQSEGCIRIPESLNDFLDRHAVLDQDYLAADPRDKRLWVLRADRTPTGWPGRYVVVIDSGRRARPAWSPPPRR